MGHRVRAAVAALLAVSGCACPERTIWDNYLWIEVMELPLDVSAAHMVVDGRRAEPLACGVTFDATGTDEGDTAVIGDIFSEDCDDAEETGTYIRGWWAQFPHRGIRSQVTMSLDWTTASGERGGFGERLVEPEWTWIPDDNPLCGAAVRGIVYIDPYGDPPVRY